eukprot:3951494-Pleurochrysis_carterae.AAC.2
MQPRGLEPARYEERRRESRPSWPSVRAARARSVGECVRVRSERNKINIRQHDYCSVETVRNLQDPRYTG